MKSMRGQFTPSSTSSNRRTSTRTFEVLSLDIRYAQTGAPIVHAFHQVEVRLPRALAQRTRLNIDIPASVEPQVPLQPAPFARRRLERHHSPVSPHKSRRQQRIQPVMCANIEHRHPRPQKPRNKRSLGSFEPIVNQLAIQRAPLRQPPGTEGQPQGQRHRPHYTPYPDSPARRTASAPASPRIAALAPRASQVQR